MSESAAELRRLIELVSACAEAAFRKHHELAPLWHCIDRDGAMHVVAAPDESKNTAAILMRAFMQVHDIIRYCYAAEAWTVTGERDLDRYLARGGKVEHHPNRQEIITFSAEDESGQMTAHRLILRRIGKDPRLGPLVVNDMQGWSSEGLLVGMLPRRGTVQ
jgi:hypothetical protein